jgi:hypothetical protein
MSGTEKPRREFGSKGRDPTSLSPVELTVATRSEYIRRVALLPLEGHTGLRVLSDDALFFLSCFLMPVDPRPPYLECIG